MRQWFSIQIIYKNTLHTYEIKNLCTGGLIGLIVIKLGGVENLKQRTCNFFRL
jgi:hypothetical protein